MGYRPPAWKGKVPGSRNNDTTNSSVFNYLLRFNTKNHKTQHVQHRKVVYIYKSRVMRFGVYYL